MVAILLSSRRGHTFYVARHLLLSEWFWDDRRGVSRTHDGAEMRKPDKVPRRRPVSAYRLRAGLTDDSLYSILSL